MWKLASPLKNRLYDIINGQFGPAGREPLLTTLSLRLESRPDAGRNEAAFPWAAIETTDLSGRITDGDLFVGPSHTLYQATYAFVLVTLSKDPDLVETNPAYVEHPDRYQTPPPGESAEAYQPGAVDILGRIAQHLYVTYGDVESLLPQTNDGFLSAWQIGRGRPVQRATQESQQYPLHVAAWQMDFVVSINEPY